MTNINYYEQIIFQYNLNKNFSEKYDIEKQI